MKIPKAMEDIPDCREAKRREMRPKSEKYDVKMSQKREIKARSVTGNMSGGMEDFPDV